MTTDRKTSKWKPGQTGNPKGRPPGQSEITRLRASLAGDVPDILAGLVTAAKGGDVQAARLILERILPPVTPCVRLDVASKFNADDPRRSDMKCKEIDIQRNSKSRP